MSNSPEKAVEDIQGLRKDAKRLFFEFLEDIGALGSKEDPYYDWHDYKYTTWFEMIFEGKRFKLDALTDDEYRNMREAFSQLSSEMKDRYNQCLDGIRKYMVEADFVKNNDEFDREEFGLCCLVFLLGSKEDLEKFSYVDLKGTEIGTEVFELEEEIRRRMGECNG